MPTVLSPPFARTADDLAAHAVLDDDGNPWDPLAPAPAQPWPAMARAQFAAATRALAAHPALSIGIALGAGYLLGRALAHRAS